MLQVTYFSVSCDLYAQGLVQCSQCVGTGNGGTAHVCERQQTQDNEYLVIMKVVTVQLFLESAIYETLPRVEFECITVINYSKKQQNTDKSLSSSSSSSF